MDNVIPFPGTKQRREVPIQDALKALSELMAILPGKTFIVYSDNNETRCITSSHVSFPEAIGLVELAKESLRKEL